MAKFLKQLKKVRISPTVGDFAGFALATAIRGWMRTLRYECCYYDRSVDPADPSFTGPCIYVFWHEYIPFMFYLRGHCDIAMLVSQHRDAELLSRAAGVMGFEIIRGSSRRGALTALRQLLRTGRGMSLTITPDGPKGPRRNLAVGCIYLASKLGLPIVPVGLGYQNPWRNRRAWDHFAIPKPWTRGCAVIGPPIQVPELVDKVGIEAWRHRINEVLNRLTELAEYSAETGIPIEGCVPAVRKPRCRWTNAPNKLIQSRGYTGLPTDSRAA